MKRTVKVKNLIAFAAVMILLFSIATIPAHATWNPTSKNRFGAWLGSALLALNITMQSTLAPIEQMYEYIADPVAQQIEYTYPATGWEDDIMNRAVVKIAPDSVTIDGRKYTDIWLSSDAAEKFRVNAFDFKTGYNIASNSGATFASGEGYIDNIPVYEIDNQLVTQSYNAGVPSGNTTFESGPVDIEITSFNAGPSYIGYPNWIYNWMYNGVNRANYGWANTNSAPAYTKYFVDNNNVYAKVGCNGYNPAPFQIGSTYTPDPFDFDYVSRNIPADEHMAVDQGLNIRVPSDTPGLQVFIENNIDYTADNGKYIDFNLEPNVKVELDDLIDIIAPIIADLDFGDVTINTMPDTPTPQPVLPDTVFPETQVDDALQPVINTINNNTQNIIENIPAPSEITQPIIQEIQDTGDEIIENIPKIDEICNNIDTAPYHDLDTGLDHLPSVFLPFITDLRSALGIWHYVTEWINQISTTFAFVTGCLVGTSIMTPIYAAIAGFMCIKVYRRMTG